MCLHGASKTNLRTRSFLILQERLQRRTREHGNHGFTFQLLLETAGRSICCTVAGAVKGPVWRSVLTSAYHTPSSSWRPSERGQSAGFIVEGRLCLGAIFLRTHLVKRKSMRSGENPRIRGAHCRNITWESLSPLPKAPAWLGFLPQ